MPAVRIALIPVLLQANGQSGRHPVDEPSPMNLNGLTRIGCMSHLGPTKGLIQNETMNKSRMPRIAAGKIVRSSDNSCVLRWRHTDGADPVDALGDGRRDRKDNDWCAIQPIPTAGSVADVQKIRIADAGCRRVVQVAADDPARSAGQTKASRVMG